jgi:hypothetical protein
MAKITANFGLQVYEGATDNVVVLSRSATNSVTSYTVANFEQRVIAANTPDQVITLPTTATKILTIENSGTVDLTVKINSSGGTALILPKTTGFLAVTTTTVVTTLYITNADPANAGSVKIFVGG